MKKRNASAIPDFSRKKPVAAGQPAASGPKTHVPDPRQKQNAPSKAKNGGRRGT